MAPVPPITDWLCEFEIALSSNSAFVHNNARQQVAVTLFATPREGQVISDSEYASLCIVVANSEGGYDTLPADSSNAPWYYTTTRDERFDYFTTLPTPASPEVEIPPELEGMEIQLDNPPRALHARARHKELYIHSRAPGGSKIHLRACIIRDDGDTYWTDKVFQADIELYAQPEPTYLFPEDYHWSHTRDDVTTDAVGGFIHEYVLSPRTVDFSYAELVAGDTQGTQGRSDQASAVLIGTAPSGDPAPHEAPRLRPSNSFPARLAANISTENPGQIAIQLQGDDKTPSCTEADARQRQHLLCAYDRQGNRHRLSIHVDNAQDAPALRRPRLSVSSAAAQDATQDISNIAFFQVKGVGRPENNVECHLYNNKYQATYVDIVIRALDEKQQPVKLTDAQLNSIMLVNYDTGAALGSSYQWYISTNKRSPDDLFEPYPGTLPAADLAPLQGDQAIRIWIKTTSTVKAQVAARLVLGNVTYHTYQKNVPVGGPTQSGRSNSSALIIPHLQNYEIAPWQFKYTRINYSNIGDDDIDLYKLNFNSSHYKICYSAAADQIHYKGAAGRNRWIEQIYFKVDHKRTANFEIFDYPHHIAINDSPGTAYAARASVKGNAPGYERNVGFHRAYLDQYGNTHRIWIRAKPGTGGQLLEWVGAAEY